MNEATNGDATHLYEGGGEGEESRCVGVDGDDLEAWGGGEEGRGNSKQEEGREIYVGKVRYIYICIKHLK